MPRRRIVLLASAAAAVVVVLVGLLLFVPKDNSSTTAAAPATASSGPLAADPTTTVRPTGVPTTGSVHLPDGGTAKLVPAQVSKDGTMSVPDQLDQATWWGATLGAP